MRDEKLIEYYERCIRNNRRWWALEKTQAIHAGYWDKTTHTLVEALIRENEILAERAQIIASDHVLDVGCGVGGSAIFLAGNKNCRVTGIDVNAHLLQIAADNAIHQNLQDRVQFLEMDFLATTFSDASFDVVWVLESFCHAFDKDKFLREVYRLLRKGGRLVVADGFLANKNDIELNKLQRYFGRIRYETVSEFVSMLTEVGFVNIDVEDATSNIMPSVRRLYYYSFPLIAWSKMGEYLGWSTRERTEDYCGYYYQYYPIRVGLSSYLIITCDVPK
jgi:tocopherol O-methyltransferase